MTKQPETYKRIQCIIISRVYWDFSGGDVNEQIKIVDEKLLNCFYTSLLTGDGSSYFISASVGEASTSQRTIREETKNHA